MKRRRMLHTTAFAVAGSLFCQQKRQGDPQRVLDQYGQALNP